jgi:hypothetical protein
LPHTIPSIGPRSWASARQHANNSYAGYGQGAAGYGKRWAARFGDGRTSDYLSHAVFASLFHQDPRYFYQGTGSNKSRLYHAVSNAWVARSDSGKKMPNYSYLLGTMVSGAISNAYYPHADQGANLVSKYNESGSIASQAVALPCKVRNRTPNAKVAGWTPARATNYPISYGRLKSS